MNSFLAMDRTEQTGFITAVLLHGLLAAALWFAMMNRSEPVPPPPALSVSLVDGTAPVSTAPDAIQEEPAPAAAVFEEAAPLAVAAPEAPAPVPVPVHAKQAPPVKTVTPKPAKKVTPTPKPAPARKAQPTPKATPKSTPKKSGGFGKDFGTRIAGIGGSGSSSASRTSGSGSASGTPAAKSGAEVRRSVSTALGSQIKPYLDRCVANSPEIDRLTFPVTVRLDRNGRASGTSIGNPSGVTDTNRPQVSPIKDCISKAINAASPFSGLDPDYYDVWKSHSMRLKPS